MMITDVLLKTLDLQTVKDHIEGTKDQNDL